MSTLSDNETNIDLLNNKAIADTIVRMLREHPARPITVGVHGDWGAGKSSVLAMIEANLETDKDVLCIRFNGWKFQGFEDAKIALIEGITSAILEKRPALTKTNAVVRELFKRIDWLKLTKKLGGLALTAYTGIPTADQLQSLLSALEALKSKPLDIFTKENIGATVDGIKTLVKPAPEEKHLPEEVRAFHAAFEKLLEEAKVGQLIVLIDDLDRCLPDTAIETLEAIRLFVLTSKTAFVIAADEGMIEYSVKKHFPGLSEIPNAQNYARNYLEKLIQVPFRISMLGENETSIYITLLLVGAELGETDQGFSKLAESARRILQRPWENVRLTNEILSKTLADKASAAKNALRLSDQISPILAKGTKGNPRQIKRFLNTLLLRRKAADARGFAGEIKLPVLAKLMLAERFIPHLFEQIASLAASSPDGKCAELANLEAASPEKSKEKVSPHKKDKETAEEENTAESAILSDWKSSPEINNWATIEPPFREIDLRPYLFVSRERKDYLEKSSIPVHLHRLFKQLFGPKLAVQSLDAELRGISTPDAAQLFEELQRRILSLDSFDSQPAGIEGLSVILKTHPELNLRLLTFLDSLPLETLGPWVVKGWENSLKDPALKSRFTTILSKWANSNNRLLKTVATQALKPTGGNN